MTPTMISSDVPPKKMLNAWAWVKPMVKTIAGKIAIKPKEDGPRQGDFGNHIVQEFHRWTPWLNARNEVVLTLQVVRHLLGIHCDGRVEIRESHNHQEEQQVVPKAIEVTQRDQTPRCLPSSRSG